jgi:4'-phosphopantetheinyl transferase EntD
VLGEILPRWVATAEALEDVPDAMLFPAEEALLGRAVDKRRREFSTARVCARAALAGLGLPPVAILTGARGAPRWPDGVVGSITHCAGYRASAVARSRDLAALGVDAEPNEALPRGVLDLIALAEERARLPGHGGAAAGEVCWDRLLFSAKEAVYKAWFPLTQQWLGYHGAAITLSPGGTFAARLLVPGAAPDGRRLTGFAGHWLVRDGLILTAIAVPGRASRAAACPLSPAA